MCIPNQIEWYTEPNRTGSYQNKPTPSKPNSSQLRIVNPNRISEPERTAN
ncbi:hypothetical protein HanRHA438_Chr17g0820251 [Helianthus annuus]|nr:hypothetical protein HanRHA438_Chr17g0820251 [Helianthus annuus]